MKNLIVKTIGLYFNSMAYVNARKAQHEAFQLFCRPFRIPLNEKQKQFFDSAEKFTVDHEESTVQGYKWGTGPRKIVFLHGWQSHSYRWKTYIEKLSKDDFTVYAIDAPGHGLSSGKFLTVPVYSSLIHHFILSLEEVEAVVAHSLGSFSLLYTFYINPLLPVKKVILMSPPGEASDFVDVFRKTLGASTKIIELIRDKFIELYDVKPDFFSARTFVTSVNVPGLIIHDEADAEAPYRYGQEIHRLWGKSKLITTRGLGHNLKSSTVVDHVVDFINGDSAEKKIATHRHSETTV